MNCHLHFEQTRFGSLRALILNLILAFACHLQAQSEPDYFPMHIGDKWTYKLTTHNITHWGNKIIEIIDTTTIQQNKYFIFEEELHDIYYEPGKIYRSMHFYRRADNGDVLKYSTLINQEQLYYTFQKDSLHRPYWYHGDYNLVDKWKIALNDTGSLIRIPSGTFVNCYIYSFGLFFGDIGGRLTRFISLAANIGLILETAEGDYNFITGAYINGQLLGDTTVTTVNEATQSKIPSQPVLHQNSPNPFKSTTQITFSVPDLWLEPVQISVYDLFGREINNFILTNPMPGHHRFQWNGTNKQEEEVSNGIYIVRLRSGRFSEAIKINLIR